MIRISARQATSLRTLSAAMCALVLALTVASHPASAEPRRPLAEDNPRLSRPPSRLHRPYSAPVYATGHVGLGGGFAYEHGRLGYGGAFVLRPAAAAHILDFLHDGDTALVLQADYQQIGPQARILSADGILRHYLGERADGDISVKPFLGAGVGASQIRIPPGEGGGREKYWSLLLEAGQEWVVDGRHMFLVKGQFRRYAHAGRNFTCWTLAAGVGLPIFR